MQNMIKEFKDFINKGDVVTIAVGLIMALYFKAIVDALLAGVIEPIIAAIFGESSFSTMSFDLGESEIVYGLVISAAIDFIAVAFILFLLVRAYNNMQKGDEEAEEESGPSEVDLLTEIRDSLQNR